MRPEMNEKLKRAVDDALDNAKEHGFRMFVFVNSDSVYQIDSFVPAGYKAEVEVYPGGRIVWWGGVSGSGPQEEKG